MCLILEEEQKKYILEVALKVNNKLEEGIFYRYSGVPAEREFCKTMLMLDKLYTRADINQMSFRGDNSQFAQKGRSKYSIFKYMGGKNCKHHWRKVEVINDEDGLPREYDRGIVDESPIERLNFSENKIDNNMENNLFEYVYDEDTMEGVYELSLVSEPAIIIEAMQFASQEESDWKVSDVERRLLVSPVLIPNQKIWRNTIKGTKGYVFASSETIEKLQRNFAKNKYGDKSTFEHEKERPVDGLYVAESWLIEDPLNDKSNALGFKDLVKGTWMVTIKIDNEDLWNDYIKTGEVKGISVSGLLGVKEVENNNELINYKMNRKTITDIVALAVQKVALEAQLMEIKVSDELSYFVSELALEAIVIDKDGLAFMDGEFIFEGNTYKTDEMGAIKEITPIEVEDVTMAEGDTVETVEAPVADIDPTIALNDKIAELEAQIVALETTIQDLEAKNVKLESDLVLKESEKVELSKQTPASKGIIDVPSLDEKKSTGGLLETMRNLK